MNAITTKSVKLVCAAIIVIAPFLVIHRSNAAELTNRSIAISSAIPAAQAQHIFSFNVPSAANIGSIEFDYCDNSPLMGTVCNAPSGLSLLTATLTNQTTNTGFSIDIINTTASKILLTRPVAAATLGISTYTFDGVINSNIPNQTIFVRISLYATVDGSGARGDNGSVAFSINGSFNVGAYVPPFLIFCAAVTVAVDCSSSNGLLISFGELLTTQTSTATSQFSGATNDPAGYNVMLIGQTMTAGNQIIPPLTVNSASSIGTSQFGINLRQNTVPLVGANMTGIGSATANASYNVQNSFRFVSGEQLVNTSLPTDYNRFTVSYMVNVSSAQQPGYYATTLTYIATAAF